MVPEFASSEVVLQNIKSRLNGFSVVIVKPMQADRASIAE